MVYHSVNYCCLFAYGNYLYIWYLCVFWSSGAMRVVDFFYAVRTLVRRSTLCTLFCVLLLCNVNCRTMLVRGVYRGCMAAQFYRPFYLVRYDGLFLHQLRVVRQSRCRYRIGFVISGLFGLYNVTLMYLCFVTLLLRSTRIVLGWLRYYRVVTFLNGER